jgi:LmbE family N-acetylglucosaminyl deacetylase
VVARRHEDEAAAGALGAYVVHLPFVDAQYEEERDPGQIAGALADVLGTAPVLVPIGLFHEDHAAAYEASVRALSRRCRRLDHVALYEDAPYRGIDGGRLLDDRVRELCRHRRLHHVAVDEDGAAAAKEVAVQCYESQLRALATANAAALDDIYRPEGYWVLDGDDDWL